MVGTLSGNCTSVRVSGGGHILRSTLIRCSGTVSHQKQLSERGVVFAHVLTSASRLNQQQDSGLGGKEVLAHYQCGATHQNPVLRRKKPHSTSILGNFEVSVCLPKLVVAFFIVCLLLGRDIVLLGANTGHQTNLALLFVNQKEITLLNLPICQKSLHPSLTWEKCQYFHQNFSSVKRYLWLKAGKPRRSQEDTNFTENS